MPDRAKQPFPGSHARGFTLIELLVVISIIALLIALLLPTLASARESALKMQGATQMRGIQQGLFVSSQDRKGFYPGVERVAVDSPDAFVDESAIESYSGGGSSAGSHVTARWCLLYDGDYITPDYGFSPGEIEADRLTRYDPQAAPGTYTIDEYLTSFALAQLIVNTSGTLTAEERLREWSDAAGSGAVTVSDRMHSGDNHALTTHSSIWDTRPGFWEGAVAYNDNHVVFASSSEVETSYGSFRNSRLDNLFADNPPGEQNRPNHANAKQIMRWRSGQLIR